MSGWVDRGDTEYGPKLEWESEEPTREEWLAAMQVEEQLIAQGRWDELVWEPDGDYSGLDQNAHGGLPEECPHCGKSQPPSIHADPVCWDCGKRLVIAEESGVINGSATRGNYTLGLHFALAIDGDYSGLDQNAH